ncbi:hypothetical protein ACFXOD_36510 [Streptomyces sp. NPDC059161]|uniref:hypothetical protein n=1 Tax=Streptomyces sp. NPDC059161 TaxID=3346749 RepID=UPI0036D148F6
MTINDRSEPYLIFQDTSGLAEAIRPLTSPFRLGTAAREPERESAFLTWNDEPC